MADFSDWKNGDEGGNSMFGRNSHALGEKSLAHAHLVPVHTTLISRNGRDAGSATRPEKVIDTSSTLMAACLMVFYRDEAVRKDFSIAEWIVLFAVAKFRKPQGFQQLPALWQQNLKYAAPRKSMYDQPKK